MTASNAEASLRNKSAGLLTAGVAAGLADPVHDSQTVFRSVLNAMARPGVMETISVAGHPPEPLDPATYLIALSMIDGDTAVWLGAEVTRRPVVDSLRFHCGCRLVVDPKDCAFAVVADATAIPPLTSFALGSDLAPEESTTLLVQVPSLNDGPAIRLTGPGIQTSVEIRPGGLRAGFWSERKALQSLYPQGLDMIFIAGRLMMALPRSSRLEG